MRGVPLGPCEIRVHDDDDGGEVIVTAGPEDGCFVNQDGQLASLSVGVACGIGFELVLVLPLVMLARRRRSRGAPRETRS